jgi:hypothetical protein
MLHVVRPYILPRYDRVTEGLIDFLWAGFEKHWGWANTVSTLLYYIHYRTTCMMIATRTLLYVALAAGSFKII